MRFIPTFLILLLLFIASGPAFSFGKPNVHRYSNGATLVTIEDPNATISSSYVFVRTGSLFESPWNGAGLSHYLEHLVAGGTTVYNSEKEYKKLIDLMGGASNAYTTFDHTAYYIKSSSLNTNLALQVLFEWVSAANWTDIEYKREKGVVLKEMSRADNDIFRQVYRAKQQRYYKDSPYRYPVIGFRDTFLSISNDDLKSYYKSRYVAENFVIVVGGNVSHNALVTQLSSTFGQLPQAAAPLRYHSSEARVLSPSFETIQIKELKTPQVVIRYPIGSFYNPDVYPLDLLAYILGNGDQSLLHSLLVTNKKIATSVSVNSITPMADYGYFEISVESDEDPKKVVEIVQNFLDKFKLLRLDYQTISKALAQKKNEYILSKASLDSYVKEVGHAMMMGQDPLFFKFYSENFNTIKAGDLQRVIKQYLNKSKRQVYAFNPPVQSTNQVNEVRQQSVEVVPLNHVNVFLIPESNNQIVRLSVQFDGGILSDLNQPGIGALAEKLIGKKVKGLARSEFQNEFESRGASISTNLSHNHLTVSMTSTVDDANALIPLFFNSVLNFDCTENMLDEAKEKLSNEINKQNESWFKEAFIRFKSIVFQEESPFSKPLNGSVDSINQLTLDDVKAYVKRRLNESAIKINIQAENPKQFLNNIPSVISINNKGSAIAENPLLNPPGLHTAALERPVGVVLRVAAVDYPTYNVKSWLTVQLIDAILSGMRYPSGLLHERLRGAELVYVVHVVPMKMANQDFLFLYALTEPHQVELVNTIVGQTFKEIRTDISLAQLKQAKAQVLFNYQSSMQNMSDRAYQYNLMWDYFGRFPSERELLEQLDLISIKDVKEAVNEWVQKPTSILFNSENHKNR